MSDFKVISSPEELEVIIQAEINKRLPSRLKRERHKVIKVIQVYLKALTKITRVLQDQLQEME